MTHRQNSTGIVPSIGEPVPRGVPNNPRVHYCECGKIRVRVNEGKRTRLQPVCPECLPGFYRDRSQASRDAAPEATREYQFNHRMKRYGLDPDEIRAKLRRHNGLCESCGEPGDYVDHCHATMTFRGFLCPGCNKALGHLGDSITKILALAAYLERHQYPDG